MLYEVITLIKGLKGSSFADIELENGSTLEAWFTQHTFMIMVGSLLFWTIILQLLRWIFNIKILKMVVLVGTFVV